MRLLAMLLAFCIGACAPPPTRTPVPVALFPEAASVRLFANPMEIDIAADGARNVGSFPEAGIELTDAEAAIVRASVKDGPPPSVYAECCIPRHAFAFYDAERRFMGALIVCFECDCASIRDAPGHAAPKVEWIYWDYNALKAIVEAHGVPISFPEQEQ